MKRGVDYIGVAAVTLCHDGNGKYLFGLRSDKCRDEHFKWDPMGSGGVEHGEKLEEAIHREVKEECSADVLGIEYLGYRQVHRETEEGETHYIVFDFKVDVDVSQVKNTEPDKCLEMGWFTLSELPENMHSQWPVFYEAYKSKL